MSEYGAIFEVLDDVKVMQDGEEFTSYGDLLVCISQELDGTLPDNSLTFDWSRCSRAKAQRVFGEHAARIRELFDDACAGREVSK
jgi:hypothetical protein